MQIQETSVGGQRESVDHFHPVTPLETQALDAANGDIPAAALWMAQAVMADAETDIAAIVRDWCETRIRIKASQWRHHIIAENRAGGGKGSFAENLAIAIKAEATRFMNMPLFGGKPIGHATADEIRQSAYRYGEVADDMKRKQRWQNLVADALDRSGAAIVADGLAEADLAELWNKVD